MHIMVFGAGPLSCEPQYPVMAPGARTWQIARSVAHFLGGAEETRLTVVTLVAEAKSPYVARAGSMGATILSLTVEDFKALQVGGTLDQVPPPDVIVGTASVQPYATAAALAVRLQVPCWIDVFGDPIAEVQSRSTGGSSTPDAESELLHVWRLLVGALLHGDGFSTLSKRQRLALIGQLGAAGRLNQHTARMELAHSIPFALWRDELPMPTDLPAGEDFVVLWGGSFNTWMDPVTLADGVARALAEDPRLRLRVLGGRIEGYHSEGYDQFTARIVSAGVADRVELLGWQPLEGMAAAYAGCHVGLSIDRRTYEATTGSRTRVLQFAAAGRLTVSTALSELTEDLAASGGVLSFEPGNAASLAAALVAAARRDRADLERASAAVHHYVFSEYDPITCAQPLLHWLAAPAIAPDKLVAAESKGNDGDTNALRAFWKATAEAM